MNKKTTVFVFEGVRFYLTIRFHNDGRIAEVLAAEQRYYGGIFSGVVQDACSLINELLRRFVSPETLSEVVGRMPDGSPASIIGNIIFHLIENQ